ncbi:MULTISPECIES: uracil-DNA glycosylase [unclassified Streptomyces]|uniref:uracil-DNA glycosylase n=1 Tax=unclassified Streptomyces TaxID=2593676 RepID=UPI004042EC74
MKTIDTGKFWRLLHTLPVPDDAEFLYGPHGDGQIRERNLRLYLKLMAQNRPDLLLVGEAPGYRGHAVTGVPFMSVRELAARPGLITGNPKGDGFEIPPTPAAQWEASPATVWKTMASWRGPLPIFWPVYPHHPHAPGNLATNRTPRAEEITAGTPVALALAEAFRVTTIVAVGRKAQNALARNGVAAEAVRHPAQGGARVFATQLATLNEALA